MQEMMEPMTIGSRRPNLSTSEGVKGVAAIMPIIDIDTINPRRDPDGLSKSRAVSKRFSQGGGASIYPQSIPAETESH